VKDHTCPNSSFLNFPGQAVKDNPTWFGDRCRQYGAHYRKSVRILHGSRNKLQDNENLWTSRIMYEKHEKKIMSPKFLKNTKNYRFNSLNSLIFDLIWSRSTFEKSHICLKDRRSKLKGNVFLVTRLHISYLDKQQKNAWFALSLAPEINPLSSSTTTHAWKPVFTALRNNFKPHTPLISIIT